MGKRPDALLVTAVLLLAASCQLLSGGYELRVEESDASSTVAAGGMGGILAGSGGGGSGQGGAGGQGGRAQGGNGGQGGSMSPLYSNNLITRYFMDDDNPLIGLNDAAANALMLTVSDAGELQPVTVPGNKGLFWPAIEGDGRASAPVPNTKLVAALNQKPVGTIEVVVTIDAASGEASRISHIGCNEESGRFTLSADDNGFAFIIGSYGHRHDFDMTWQSQRMVVHAVYDVDHPVLEQHVRLYVNGVSQPRNTMTSDMLPMSDLITLNLNCMEGTTMFVLGNRPMGGRSIQGSLHYAAMYAEALSLEQITLNAGILGANDDS